MVYNINGDALSNVLSLDGTVLSAAYAADGSQVFSGDPYIAGRTITFEDDFIGTALDETKWTYELGYGRNNELQQFWKRCVAVENGCLVIAADKVDNTNMPYKSWQSGSVLTQGLFAQTYGRFEAKIKFPNVVGAFPAFWLTGSSLVHYWQEGARWTSTGHWPACGEIDIVEMMPGNANTAKAGLWDSSTTAQSPATLGSGESTTYDPAAWHIYAVEWTPTYMAMFLDGTEYKRYSFSDYQATQVSAYTGAEQMYVILNLSVGAAGGTPAASTSRMQMYVDWVRVYAPLSAGEGASNV